jgi:hypothetical protein
MLFTKINSKGITDLIIKLKIMKVQEDNIEKCLHDFRFGNDVLDIQSMKYRFIKLDLFKIKIFCSAKVTSKR